MLEPSLVRDVLDAALATGGDFAELFMEDRRDTSLILQLNRLETVNSGRIHGAGVRVYVGLNAIYAYTNDTSREGLIACARQAASAVRERGRELAACAELTLSPVGDAHPVKLLPSRTDTRRKADILRAANAAAREAFCAQLCEKLPPQTARAVAQVATGVQRENLVRTMDAVRGRYGTFEAYFKAEHGLDADGLAALRGMYLE